MDLLKKYGFILIYASIIILLSINFTILKSSNKSIREERVLLAEAKKEHEEAEEELNLIEKKLQSETKKDRELSEQIEVMVNDSEKYMEDQEKLKAEARLLVEKKEELLKGNYKNYDFDHRVKISEELIINALSIIQEKEVKSGEYEWKVDTSDYQIAAMYKKDEFYLLYAFDHFVAVFSLTKDAEMKYIYITDIKNNVIVASKPYDLPYLE